MKLDSRIIDGMKPLGVFDTEEAKRFIGKECYFANAESVFSNIDDNPFMAKGILTSIDENSEYAFHSEGILKSMSVVMFCLVNGWKHQMSAKQRD